MENPAIIEKNRFYKYYCKIFTTKKSATSIIELVVSIFFIATLAGTLAPLFFATTDSSKITRANEDLAIIAGGIKEYYQKHGNFLQEDSLITINGENYSLDTGVHGTKNWIPGDVSSQSSPCVSYLNQKGLIPSYFIDPWERSYQIILYFVTDIEKGGINLETDSIIKVRSLGKDGLENTSDDLVVDVLSFWTNVLFE